MSNFKGEIKEYLDSVKKKYPTEAEVLIQVDKELTKLNKSPATNRSKIMFYNQMKRYLMPKENSLAVLNKAFGKPLKPTPKFGYADVWSVGNDNGKDGYFITSDEDGLSYIQRIPLDSKLFYNKVILEIEFNRVEKFIKFVKNHQKKV